MSNVPETAMDKARTEKLVAIDPAFSASKTNVFADELAQAKQDAARLPFVLEALKTGLADMDPEIRADAAEAFGFLRSKDASVFLREAIHDDDGEVRTQAAVAMIRLGEDSVFPAVVRSLRNPDPRVVIGAAVVLGHLRDQRVVPNLIEAFKTDHEEVGAAVAWALGQCQDVASNPWLVTAVEQGFATANACEALGQIGDVSAFETLRGVLHDAREDVRAYAARAIGKLSFPDDGEPNREQATIPLRTLLDDESRKVRLCAALSLFDLGEGNASSTLASAVTGALEEG